MTLFFRARGVLPITLTLLIFQVSLIGWGSAAIKAHFGDYFEAIPLSVIAQFIPAALIAYVADSSFRVADKQASRALFGYRLVAVLVPLTVSAFSLSFACLLLGEAGTLDTFAPLRALLGLCGVTLVATLAMDRRLVAVASACFSIYPIMFDPRSIPFMGFTVDENLPNAWYFPVILAGLGATLVARRS